MNEADRDTQYAIKDALERGCSLRHTARSAGVAKGTVMRYKRLLAAGYDVDMETRHQVPWIASPATIERAALSSAHSLERVVSSNGGASNGTVCSCGWWSGMTYDYEAAHVRHQRRPNAKAQRCSVVGCNRKRGAGSKCAQHFLRLI